MEDYVVRYGGSNYIGRSEYVNKRKAEKIYDKINLDTKTTWKELLYEPLDEPEKQIIIKSDSVKVLNLGICKIAIPENK